MTVRTRKGIVWGILVIAVIWAVWNWSAGDPGESTAQRAAGESDLQDSVPALVLPAGSQAGREITNTPVPDWHRDPFARPGRRLQKKRHSNTAWVLTAVSHLPGRPMAVLSGSVVEEGSEIDGWLVQEISRESLVLRCGSEKTELTLTRRQACSDEE